MIVYLICQFEPSSEVSASITGYISAYLLRGGAYGYGTLLRVSLPVTLSYQAIRPPGKRWCLDLSARLSALQVRAGIFYQWRNRWSWRGLRWGRRRTLVGFGRSSGITWNGRLLNKCAGMWPIKTALYINDIHWTNDNERTNLGLALLHQLNRLHEQYRISKL